MSDPHTSAMASGALDSNLLTIGLNLLKKVLGFDTPIATAEEFKSKVAGLIATAELIAGFTPTQADDDLVAKAKGWLGNDLVLQVLWIVYQKLVASPATAAELTPERFGALLQEATETSQTA